MFFWRTAQAHGPCDNLKGRAEIVYIVLNYLVAHTPLATNMTHDFRFWYGWWSDECANTSNNTCWWDTQTPYGYDRYDLTDSTVLGEETFQLLSYPVLSFGTLTCR